MTEISEKFLKIVPKKFITKQSGNFSLLAYVSYLPGMFKKYMSELFDFDFGAGIFIGKENYGILFFDDHDYGKTTDYGWNDYKKAGGLKDFKHNQIYKDTEVKINEVYLNVFKNIESFSDTQIINYLKNSYDLTGRLVVSTIFCESLNKERLLTYYSKIGNKNSKQEDFLNISIIPIFSSFDTEFNKLILGFKDNKDYEKIAWIFTSYYSFCSKEKLDQKIDEYIKERGGIDNIKENILKSEKEEVINKINFDNFKKLLTNEEIQLADFTQYSMELRDRRKEAFFKIITSIAYLVSEILKRKNIDQDLSLYFSPYDFADKLYESKDLEEILKERKDGFLLYIHNDGHEFEMDFSKIKECENEISSIIVENESFENGLSGTIACKGKVTGKVCLVKSSEEFSKMKNGDILVTSMTRPEFVPLMKISSAIITDEGGLTCHAAIVSRELKIPCIVGTKVATHILKDGDIVEVDAEKGIVKIIK